jgi:Tfp pilus assembly protein PilF
MALTSDRFFLSTVLLTAALTTTQLANAQPHPATPPATDAAAPATEAQKMEEARQRYQRGLQLYNENNFEAARVEFERAYQLAPSYKILYNIGLCYEQLGDYVQAQSTLKRFLDLAATEVTPERRAEVEKELAQIAPRIASARIKLNVDGTEIFVDDICAVDKRTSTATCGETVGSTREVLLNPGRRRITVKKSGYLPETQVISVAGSDQVDIRIDLKPLTKSVVAKETNPYVLPMIIGWGVTAAGATTAIITGVLTNNAADDQSVLVNRFGTTRPQLDDARDKTETLATVTDVVWIGTGVAALASTYFTIRAVRWKGGTAPEANVQVGLGSVGLRGRF